MSDSLYPHFEAAHYAHGRLAEIIDDHSPEALLLDAGELRDPPCHIYDYIFRLQGSVEQDQAENDRGMDYCEYARRMWRDATGGEEAEGDAFSLFKKSLIFNLHEIEMRPLVHPDLGESLKKLVATYCGNIATVALWSTGDDRATGYQHRKIQRSGLISEFVKAHRAARIGNESGESGMQTAYLVADNKFSRLAEYARKLQDLNGQDSLKFVVIEDSVGNFEKAERAITQAVGSEVEIIPIWFTDSRAGIVAQAQIDCIEDDHERELAQATLDERKNVYNAIASFDELLEDVWLARLKNAHVLVDFDGVIGDNVAMRDVQARVTYGSLVRGLMVRGSTQDYEMIEATLFEQIRSLPLKG